MMKDPVAVCVLCFATDTAEDVAAMYVSRREGGHRVETRKYGRLDAGCCIDCARAAVKHADAPREADAEYRSWSAP